MRRISFWFMSTLSALVMLFTYHTSTNSAAASSQPFTPTDTSTNGEGIGDSPTATAGRSEASSGSTTTGTTTKTVSGTFTGGQANTCWGLVQVRITVAGGKITSSQAIEYPNGNGRDQQINAYALPILNAAVVKAQSANIDAVSGATVTSDGYISSLQSAIDQAHL